jgi:predicted metalloprotease with PDZ domain
MIHYTLRLKYPESHQFEVKLEIEQPDPRGQIVYLPAWIRGSYMIRDYARNVIELKAFCDDEPIRYLKLDKQNWQFEPVKGPLTIIYIVYAWELSVRAAYYDTTHAYFNGSALFMGVANQEATSCQLNIERPDDPRFQSWRVATGMPPQGIDQAGFGAYLTEDYEALIDYPVEIGDFSCHTFHVANVPHKLIVSGLGKFEIEVICKKLELICSQQVKLFGELPVQSYHFLLRIVGDGYGGLEHKNSTSLIFPRGDLFGKKDHSMPKGYRRLLALCSHEYFHLWNVKRITPEVFLKGGTDREIYTRQLWIFEGITSYYDELMLVRGGVIDRKSYFEMLATTVTRVMRGSGRHKQTLEESSFDAWIKFYKQDENAPNAIVSYYAKGALFALVLDLTLRLETKNHYSLDCVMQEMWLRYGKTGCGVPEGAFEHLTCELTSLDLQTLFDMGLRSTQDLPVAELLAKFGVEMQLQPARSSSDSGGVTTQNMINRVPHPVLGAKCKKHNNQIRIQQVFDGGAAQKAGLSGGDEIIAVDGLRMNIKQMEDYLADMDLGVHVKIHIFRRDELLCLELVTAAAPSDTCVFHLPELLCDEKQQRLDSWLLGHAG